MKSYCSVEQNRIRLGREIIFEREGQAFTEFSKNVYSHFGFAYPKFYKMDNLSKLAFIGAELLLKKEAGSAHSSNVALVLGNSASSLDTDFRFQSSISDTENYFPSPAVFVYTLPNICLGEISIRHGLKSETCFFVLEKFDQSFFFSYARALLDKNKAGAVICGWVDYLDEDYTALFYLLENKSNIG